MYSRWERLSPRARTAVYLGWEGLTPVHQRVPGAYAGFDPGGVGDAGRRGEGGDEVVGDEVGGGVADHDDAPRADHRDATDDGSASILARGEFGAHGGFAGAGEKEAGPVEEVGLGHGDVGGGRFDEEGQDGAVGLCAAPALGRFPGNFGELAFEVGVFGASRFVAQPGQARWSAGKRNSVSSRWRVNSPRPDASGRS